MEFRNSAGHTALTREHTEHTAVVKEHTEHTAVVKEYAEHTAVIGEMTLLGMTGTLSMPASFQYKDVYQKGFPRHDGWDWFRRRHPPMPASRWAKIYAPFDALRGFDEAIKAKEAESLINAGDIPSADFPPADAP